MSTNAGLDLRRGRPLPAIGSTEAKLQQRKLDALKRGIHRIPNSSEHPFGIHLIAVGEMGASVAQSFLNSAPTDLLDPPGSRLTVLGVDIGDEQLKTVRDMAFKFPGERSQIETVSLDLPAMDELQASISKYIDFLKLEYPLYHPNQDSTAWLPADAPLRDADGSVPRSVAKAAYGRAYYDGDRPMHRSLRRFASSVEATGGDSVVAIVFGLGDSVGSGIALDLARHLSSGTFGRRILVTGVGIAPHQGDCDATRRARLHAVFSELDVLCDETKNKGITLSCGDLFKNPFTAGFIIAPQPADMAQEDARATVERQLSSLFTERRGANFWEALRLLNWVAAPSTQHSAARTPWGSRWIHMFGFGSDNTGPPDTDFRSALGLLPEYQPEFLELRTSETASDQVAETWLGALNSAFGPEVPPHKVDGGAPGTIQYLLPRIALKDLSAFQGALAAYDAEPLEQRHLHHALLLEQGLILCESSKVIEGMAGASIGEGKQWIAVPLRELRGEDS
ncbi:hypothetical protein [Ancylobacter sp. IITR112]|uniref:hypothetical protein n=1 Tax=Ancylobacter sp. IITR112 TaxID=3138073 RepID=UPI00352A242F